MIDEVEKIDSILKEKNISLTVATVPMLTTEYKFEEMLNDHENIFTLEEHFVNGGFGTILSEYCNDNDINKRINKYGIKNEYIHKIGNRDYLREYYGIDAKSIAKKIMGVCNG